MTDEDGLHNVGEASFERPVKRLSTYYFWISLLTGPLFPIFFIARMCKYWTLRYTFDDEGIAMKWGVLWRREIHLTYRRIQDIHLTRNVLQRWMNLANVSLQTAGGSATPEMVIEGAPNPEVLRDVLYGRMRGGVSVTEAAAQQSEASNAEGDRSAREAVALLTEIRDLLKERAQ